MTDQTNPDERPCVCRHGGLRRKCEPCDYIEQIDEAHRYLERLAAALVKKHYPENLTWKPLPDLPGLVTQLDNMTCGLPTRAEIEALSKRISELEPATLARANRPHMAEEPTMTETKPATDEEIKQQRGKHPCGNVPVGECGWEDALIARLNAENCDCYRRVLQPAAEKTARRKEGYRG